MFISKMVLTILYCFHRAFSLTIQLTNKCTNINYFIVFISVEEYIDTNKNYKVVYVCTFVG
jgi:hypothetical protein